MKKGIYLSTQAGEAFSGVEKKIQMQMRVFSSHFQMERVQLEKEETSFVKSVLWRMPFGSFGRKYEKSLVEIRNLGQIDFFYIRQFLLDRRAYRFLRQLRIEYPNCKIIVELPTYPYKGEVLHNKTMWPFYYKDKMRIKKVGRLIDRYAAVTWDLPIGGIPVIKIANGFIVDDVKLPDYQKVDNENNQEIHLLAVAQMQKHHGYERMINGLHEYYQNGGDRNIVIDFVGEGGEKSLYEEMVDRYQLGENVIFHGKKNAEELQMFYERADIGLGSFGFYKIQLTTSSVLKMREYLAYGLPVISGCKEDFIKDGETCQYYRQFPNDPSSVDMKEVLSFYDNVRQNKSKVQIRNEIHQYAKEHVDMAVVMKPVIDYLEEQV